MSTSLRIIGSVLLLAFVLVGCAKDEPVKPCTDHDGSVQRSMKAPTGPGDAFIGGTHSGNGPSSDLPDNPKDGGISDDGDDMADRERSKKRSRN